MTQNSQGPLDLHLAVIATEIADLEIRCRGVLARMAHGCAVLRREVPADVRRALLRRRLVTEWSGDLLEPTPQAAGYCHDPSTFEV